MGQEQLINPFAGYGGIVYGDRFIGRKEELQQINQRVLSSSSEFGNLAIMGLPRIGKSSLAWQAIMLHQHELREKRIVAVWLTTSDFDNSLNLLQSFSSELCSGLMCCSSFPKISMDFINEKDSFIQTATLSSVKNDLTEILREVKSQKFKIILILDEFDAAQSFLTTHDFSYLRTISYLPDRKICIVTTSRKTIKAIEATNGAVSNLFGTFESLRLSVYDDNSLKEYWTWVLKYFKPDVPFSIYKKEAEQKVGRHPFLLDVFNSYKYQSQVLEKQAESQQDVDLIDLFMNMEGTMLKERVKEVKPEVSLLDAAMQLVIGPVYNVKPDDIPSTRLIHYGFLRSIDRSEKDMLLGYSIGPTSIDGKSYICFSDFFTHFFILRHVFNTPYWPEWAQTEKKLRTIVKFYISQTYGDDWEQQIQAKFGNRIGWKAGFEKMISWRNNSLLHFPLSSKHLVDYTAPSTIFEVFINPAWNEWFYGVFQGQKSEWQRKFKHLAIVRNPVAHNSEEFISQEELALASRYCNEILKAIEKWEKKQYK